MNEPIRPASGRHEIEATVQYVVWEGYDSVHQRAKLELTLSSPQQSDMTRHGATTVALKMERTALLQLAFVLQQQLIETGLLPELSAGGQGVFQQGVRGAMQPPSKCPG